MSRFGSMMLQLDSKVFAARLSHLIKMMLASVGGGMSVVVVVSSGGGRGGVKLTGGGVVLTDEARTVTGGGVVVTGAGLTDIDGGVTVIVSGSGVGRANGMSDGLILLIPPGGESRIVGIGGISNDTPVDIAIVTGSGETVTVRGVIVTGGTGTVTCGTGMITSGTGTSSGTGSPEVKDSDVTLAGGRIFFCGPLKPK
jgi:hypothetical protein